MTERQHYVDQLKIKLDQWNSDIDELEAKAKTIGSDVREEYQKTLATLIAKRDEAAEKFEELQNTTDSAWNDVKHGFENAWQSISDAFTSAKSKFLDREHSRTNVE